MVGKGGSAKDGGKRGRVKGGEKWGEGLRAVKGEGLKVVKGNG
jgi:hypothetical protein